MKIKTIIVIILTLIIILSGCGCLDGEDKIVIGGKPFNEQYILGEMIALLLEDEGFSTEIKATLNDLTLFEGIKKGQIDVYVEYTGTAYSQVLKLEPLDTWEPDTVYDAVVAGLADEGIDVLFKIGFRDDYAIAVPENWAADNEVNAISDLVPYASNLTFGSDLVFHERDDGLPQLEIVYNLDFGEVRSMEPTLMYEAIKQGDVDAIPPYTTDTRVDLYNLKILVDDKSALPPYETMLLINQDLSENSEIIQALSVLENLVDTDTMRTLNAEFDIEGRDARDIAEEFLISEGLLEG
ncbi:glycine betaine ABC transporter substrate-binding protein [Thermoplasmatota archaeon]